MFLYLKSLLHDYSIIPTTHADLFLDLFFNVTSFILQQKHQKNDISLRKYNFHRLVIANDTIVLLLTTIFYFFSFGSLSVKRSF